MLASVLPGRSAEQPQQPADLRSSWPGSAQHPLGWGPREKPESEPPPSALRVGAGQGAGVGASCFSVKGWWVGSDGEKEGECWILRDACTENHWVLGRRWPGPLSS